MLCWGPDGSRWGVRRLLTHINNLPLDSATARKQQGVRAGWDQTAEINAGILDELRKLNYYFVAANGGSPEKPEFFPRPGEQQEPETVPLSALGSLLIED